jgi:hypothetical protein
MTNLILRPHQEEGKHRQFYIEDRLQLIEDDVANVKCALTMLNCRLNTIENHLNMDKTTVDGVRIKQKSR